MSKYFSEKYKDLIGDTGAVVELKDFDRSKIRQLVDYLASLKPGITVAIVNDIDNKLQILVKNLNASKDASQILKGVFEISEGRGGGKKDFAQGGTNDNTKLKEVVEYLKTQI